MPRNPLEIQQSPFLAGGGADIVVRLIGQKLSEAWGQSVVVENRGGAAGNLGAQALTKAPPDGYTLLMTSSALAINATLYGNPGFAAKDFVSVVRTGEMPSAVFVHPSVPAFNLRELLDLAKGMPSPLFQLTYVSSGTGTAAQIVMEWVKKQANVEIKHVPLTTAGALAAVMGKQAPIGISSMPPTVLPHVKTGRLRLLAVTSAERVPSMPDVPTVGESGFPGFPAVEWVGLFAPAGTRAPVVTKVNSDVNSALEAPDVREKLGALGIDSPRNSQPEFESYVQKEIAAYARAIKEVGAKVD